jgi:hypothetical protein
MTFDLNILAAPVPSHEEQCDAIVAAFEEFEVRVVESQGDAFSQHLMDRLMENLSFNANQRHQNELRNYLCQYVGE